MVIGCGVGWESRIAPELVPLIGSEGKEITPTVGSSLNVGCLMPLVSSRTEEKFPFMFCYV